MSFFRTSIKRKDNGEMKCKSMLVAVCGLAALVAMADEFKAGFARVDITPPIGTGLSGGMQAGETVADGALEPAADAICSAKPEAQPPTEASAGRTMRITTLYEMTYICTRNKGTSCLSPQ